MQSGLQAILETEKDLDTTRQRLHRLEEERCARALCCARAESGRRRTGRGRRARSACSTLTQYPSHAARASVRVLTQQHAASDPQQLCRAL